MKKTYSKILSAIMAVVLILNIISINTFAVGNFTIEATSVQGLPGDTVDVKINVQNNPGLTSLVLNLEFNDTLTLENIEVNSELEGTYTLSETLDSPVIINWQESFSDFTFDSFATLTFRIDENAQPGDAASIDISYKDGDIYNADLVDIEPVLINGLVTVIDGVPGDISGDQTVNNKDVTMLLRYLANWNVEILEPALDINGDGSINNKDVTVLLRFLANWDVEVFFGGSVSTKCEHEMSMTAGQFATCEEDGNIEYWTCSKCGKYYKDRAGYSEIALEDTILPATGHTIVIDEAVEPTYTTTGLTEGKHCSVCGKIIQAQEIIPMLEKEQYAITYSISSNDSYLQGIEVENSNPSVYASEDGLKLSDLTVDGYVFEGWYDGAGSNGELVKEISKGTTGNITLYARWTEETYSIIYKTYLTPIEAIENDTYTIKTGKMDLVNPNLDNYVFIGWYDTNGNEVTEISVGTTGDVVLNAYWTSKRNLTKSVDVLEEPIIFEDISNDTIYFTYEIGTIENVPLKENWSVNSLAGLEQELSQSVTFSIGQEEAETIGETISKSTLDSDTWTLSQEWNNTTSVSEEWAEENSMTVEEAEETVKSSSGTYAFTSSNGGENATSTSDNTTTREYSETGVSATAGVELESKVSTSVGTGAASPVQCEVGGEFSTGFSISGTVNDKSGTDTTSVDTKSNTSATTFNSSSSSSSTSSESQTSAISTAISETISNTKGYGESYSESGGDSSTKALEITEGEEEQHTNCVVYSNAETTTTTKTYRMDGKIEGCYRSVIAGTIHVFAIVKYDVASNSYSVSTMNILDDKTYEWLDYSTNMNFNDNENGVIPFEIPYFVHEYVSEKIVLSEGLTFKTNSAASTATITSYTGDSTEVNIPSYISDGTNSYKVVSLADNLFEGTSVIKVYLGQYIDEISDGAFKNCSDLQEVSGYFTKIGDESFSGCVSLSGFEISSSVSEIGVNAFKDVPELNATLISESYCKNILVEENTEQFNLEAIELTQNLAQAIIDSGANIITLDVSDIIEGVNFDLTIPVMESFELKGDSKTRTELTNLNLNSNAVTTKLTKLIINNASGVPIKASSDNIILDTVSITSSSYCMLLSNETTNINFTRDNVIESQNYKAVVCKNLNLQSESVNNIVGYLDASGNLYCYGDVSGDISKLYIENGSIVYISEEDFDAYIKGTFTVTFDPDEGLVEEETREVSCNTEFGTLPTPTKDYYTFDGWYTELDGGTRITDSTIMTTADDLTVYAHWTINETSTWILSSELPTGAQIVDTKWAYTERFETTSSSSTLSGWTKYDESYVWSDWSSWSKTNPSDNSDREEKTQTIAATYKTQYHYYNWCTNAYDRYTTESYANSQGTGTAKLNELWSDTKLDVYLNDNGFYIYKGPTGANYNNPYWLYADGTYGGLGTPTRTVVNTAAYTEYSYRDKIWTYYFYQEVDKEADSYPEGENISDVLEWVQYIAK